MAAELLTLGPSRPANAPGHEERIAAAGDVDRLLHAVRRFAKGLVGLPATVAVARVETEGLLARVVDLDDGAGSWLTADLRPDRVTLFLRHSVVERATAG